MFSHEHIDYICLVIPNGQFLILEQCAIFESNQIDESMLVQSVIHSEIV